MHVLVTGAGGFSGSVIAARLSGEGHRVTQLRGPRSGGIDLASGTSTLPVELDAIVHAAALSPAPGVTDEDMRRSNVEGTRNLVEHAKRAGVRCFVYLSSLSAYGRIEGGTVDEATPVRDPDVYGKSKLEGETLVCGGAFRSLAIRLPGVLGPGSVRNWLTGVLEKARAGRDIEVFSPHAPFNNAAHVSDLADFVCGLVSRTWEGHDAVTIGAAGQTTVGEAVRILVDAFGGRSKIVVRQAPKPSFLVSSARASERYGYRPMEIGAMLRRFAQENA
jgi:nucleoside-diphosphate-sugar epimerase